MFNRKKKRNRVAKRSSNAVQASAYRRPGYAIIRQIAPILRTRKIVAVSCADKYFIA